MSINVTVVGATGVSATIGNSDIVQVGVGGSLSSTPLTALQVTAGANITITTSSGVYTFIGPNVPVQSVNGQTGAVSLSLTNLTAAAASHTHVMANIADLAFPVNAVNGKTGTVVLTSADVSAASAVHSHVASDITNLTSVANVISVNGQTGVAVLNSTDVSAASAVHSHVASDITNLTSVANVVSVNGITGTPVIVGGSGVTVSTAGSSITIEASGGTGGANVVSVNGQTGSVSIVAGGNVTVSSSAGVVTIAAPAPGDALPSQAGNANGVLGSDGTAASWVPRYSVVEPVLVAGGGIVFSKDTVAGSITVESLGGIVGNTAASVSTKSLASSQNDYDAGTADIVRLSPSAAVTLTGLAGGVDGVVRVLYNVSTHVVTLASESTQSQTTNRFSIVSGNIALDEGDSSSVWYDGTSQRWRALEDQIAEGSSGGAGGGIAMSYLFG